MSLDQLRAVAVTAARVEIERVDSNVLADSRIWQVVDVVLEAVDAELARVAMAGVVDGWAICDGNRPLLVVPTKRIARQQRRILAARRGRSRFDYSIIATNVSMQV